MIKIIIFNLNSYEKWSKKFKKFEKIKKQNLTKCWKYSVFEKMK